MVVERGSPFGKTVAYVTCPHCHSLLRIGTVQIHSPHTRCLEAFKESRSMSIQSVNPSQDAPPMRSFPNSTKRIDATLKFENDPGHPTNRLVLNVGSK